MLTGAGFTNNFGSHLAHEVWAEIFNDKNIQKYPEIINSLYNTQINIDNAITSHQFDYEAAYHQIIYGKYDGGKYHPYKKEVKDAFKGVIKLIYERIDDIVRNHMLTDRVGTYGKFPEDTNIYDLVRSFDIDTKENYIFTINQDIFIERHIKLGFYIPGFPVNERATNIFGLEKNKQLDDKHYYYVPNLSTSVIKIEDRANKDNHLFYIKLHGSCNWFKSIKDSSEHVMIIGYNKIKQSKGEPLLNYYHDVFTDVVNKGDVNILIIGYGFKDDNINKILKNAVYNNGLRLHVINPAPINKFYEFNQYPLVSENLKLRRWIEDGLKGYYPYKLSDIMANDILFNTLKENFFN